MSKIYDERTQYIWVNISRTEREKVVRQEGYSDTGLVIEDWLLSSGFINKQMTPAMVCHFRLYLENKE